ncbi:alpha/beta hydrolase [Kitasatospora sp. DSM 101779]|uniref:alpha/beta hydrolase n=1 Tax=Kitasatospora sp. DSM 101779 TaxID=2853165 RepID=UPI0021D83B68|nr:hypothetical protein [Kitasatospora sp. DSM 101779]MCU7821232.1 hypothetical protein [Kitasatospora sp. DSM 101779]
MGPAIVYVHGIGNKPPEQQLKEQWDAALFGRPMGEVSRMAYWAPLRYHEPLPGPVPDDGITELPASGAALEAAGPTAPAPPEEFLAAVRAETGTGALESTAPGPLDPWLRNMVYAAEALSAGEGAPGAAAGLEVLPLPRFGRTLAFQALARHAFKDVHAYFFGGMREQIQKVAASALEEADGPLVVVGHSLGSVIAYEVLRTYPGEVPLLITIGSPLGITEIQDRLTAPLTVPPGVAAWRNACDARDLVALDHTVRPEYEPSSLTEDVLVVNDSANHHGAAEYLACPAVRAPVRARLGT